LATFRAIFATRFQLLNSALSTRRVLLVEKELFTLTDHLISSPVFSGICVTRWSLVLYVCFVDHCLSFCIFFFWQLCFLFFWDTLIWFTPLVSSNSLYIWIVPPFWQGKQQWSMVTSWKSAFSNTLNHLLFYLREYPTISIM
jgi:hypothetical protein